MNAKLASLKSHCANWREWEMNPIVIKELRQGVRSWTVTGMLLLFLVVLFIASLGFLITQSFDVAANLGLGGAMLSTFIVILAGASIFFIPLYIGVRVAAERQENNTDLLYVSTLSPARIILGKFLCSAYIAVLFFSACMPFMAFTNLLRGVDLPTVFFILAFLFLVVCGVNMIAIFLACLPLSRPFKFLFVLYGIGQSIGIIAALVSISYEFMRSGIGALMGHRDFWIATLTSVWIGVAITGMFFVLAVALISPPSANRALPVRIYFTAFWLIGGIITLFSVVRSGEPDSLIAWMTPTFMLMMLALLVSISNNDQLSQRVRRKIPASGWKRFIAFFFFNGAAGGVVWVGGILLATYAVVSGTILAYPGRLGAVKNLQTSLTTMTAMTAYAFAYSLTALFIHRKFMAHRPAKLTGLLAVLLAGGWAIAPAIFLFFINNLSWKSIDGLQLGNVFNIALSNDNDHLAYHEYFAGGWVVLALLVNAKWFSQQVRNFCAPETTELPPITRAENG